MVRCIDNPISGTRFKWGSEAAETPIYGDGEFFIRLAAGWIPLDADHVRRPSTGDILKLSEAIELGIARRV